MNKKNAQPSVVYILQMGEFDIYRVGMTTFQRKKDRFRILQHGNPYKLKCVFIQEFGPIIAPIVESMLLIKLHKYKGQTNDWFHVSYDKIIEIISNL